MSQIVATPLAAPSSAGTAGILPQPARITAVGTAQPPNSYSQQEILDEFGISDERIRALFGNSAIERRHLCLPPKELDGTRRTETQGELLAKHRRAGLDIGRAAVTACLSQAGATLEDVGHLCCVSSTGFLTPGFSALLIKELGLRRDCSRLDVVGMGCNAGLNALAATCGWASTHPGRLALMVCIEVCSAAYVFDETMRTAVVNSLFGDGAAAVTLVAGASTGTGTATGIDDRTGGPTALRFASHLIPDAVDAMRYDWDDGQGRFSFFLDAEVPYVVGANAEQALDGLLAGTGVRRSDIAHWIVHSGGKKVIDAVRVNLGLSRYDVRHTSSVLRDYGNLSSGSFLYSYRRLLEEGVVERGDHGVLMTMGPGSTIELALVRW